MKSIDQIENNYFQVADIDKNRLKDIISKFPQAKILILGDLILDEYLYGYPERVSREAPVIILKYLKSKFALGGAANAAANTAALGAQTSLIGILGDDNSAEEFSKICKEANINLLAITDQKKGTTCKTRIISNSNSNPDAGTVLQQQVLRVDRENSEVASKTCQERLLEALKLELDSCDLVLLSDYSNGVISDENSEAIVKALKSKIYIADSNEDFKKFKNAYSLTPNQPDLEKFCNKKINNETELLESALQLCQNLKIEELLVTRGAKGMALINANSINYIPALNLSEVFDVSGAGDTVSAAYSLSLAVGASPLEAALIGNLAASLVVRKYGTATTNQEEIIDLIDSL